MSTVAAALADMSKWEDVATELYVRGIVGIPGEAYCPVAKYLAEFGDCCVTRAFVAEFPPFTSEVFHPLPANVTQFVIDFDALRHPELDERNVEN